MLNPQHLAIFVAIVRTGSISAAAKQLGATKSVVSRQLARLEEDLGARLIQRSTRRLAVTEIGELVLREARQIDHALNNIEQLAGEHQQHPTGTLRVSCSTAGRGMIMPLLVEFTQLYPDVKVCMQFEDRMVDLIDEQIDVAIRASTMPDSSLIARKLADNPRVVVAAPSYLAHAGQPATPQELPNFACLVYTSGTRVYDDWTFAGKDQAYQIHVNGPIQLNDGGALVNAALAGAGIIVTSTRMVEAELANGSLIQLMPEHPPMPAPAIFAVYPARDWLALKTSAFIAFLQERLNRA